MHTVYILKSKKSTGRIYIGLTADVGRRINEHNQAKSGYSRVYAPWELLTHITFTDRTLAASFERYLKSGSGQAFLKKRLIPGLDREK